MIRGQVNRRGQVETAYLFEIGGDQINSLECIHEFESFSNIVCTFNPRLQEATTVASHLHP